MSSTLDDLLKEMLIQEISKQDTMCDRIPIREELSEVKREIELHHKNLIKNKKLDIARDYMV